MCTRIFFYLLTSENKPYQIMNAPFLRIIICFYNSLEELNITAELEQFE